MSEDAELESLRKEAAALRDLVRELSAALARAVDAQPPGAALALAKGNAGSEPIRLEHWSDTVEMTRADVAAEMALLWRRLPPREEV